MMNRPPVEKTTKMVAPQADHTAGKRHSSTNAITSETLQALAAGSHLAFEEVFLAYFEKVKQFITILIKSADIAEELSQEMFANIWINRAKIDPDRNFNAYLYTIARNTVYNYVKSRNVHDKYVQSSWNSDQSPDAEDIIVAKEMELMVNIAVSRMPKQRRMVYELSRDMGLSNDEIAQRLGITRNAVEKQLRLATNDIREVLAILAVIFTMML